MVKRLALALLLIGLLGGTASATSVRHLRSDSTESRIKRAVAKTKYPKTLYAIAVVESSLNPHAVGDGGRSKGLYQIREDLHGRVPHDIEGQTKKAAKMFDTLVKQYGYRNAIRKWNGSGEETKKYRSKVMLAMR